MWETDSEENTTSFTLSRSDLPAGPFSAIGSVIPAAGTPTSGALYDFFDTSGSSGHYYRLTETETDGTVGSCTSDIKANEAVVPITPVDLQVQPGQNPNYGVGTADIGPPYKALIICPDAWADSVSALRDHWIGFRHHATLLVPLSHTGPSADDIRLFILFHPTVEYVLLVGDTANRLETQNVIPTWYVQDPWKGQLMTDAPYGDRDGDELADIALGRWPAHSSAEAAVCTKKSIDYDFQDPDQGWRRQWTGLTNDDGTLLVDGALTSDLSNDLLALTPGSFPGAQLRTSEIPCCYENQEVAAINAVNGGVHFLWMLGTWASKNTMCFLANARSRGQSNVCMVQGLRYESFDLSRFESNRACGFWFPLSCGLGGIDQQDVYDCFRQVWIPPLAEDLLLMRDRGPLTWFGPTRGTFQMENYDIGAGILSRLTYVNRLSVGRVCINAIKAFVVANPNARARAASYVFLGDPTIVMAWSDVPTDVVEAVGSPYRLSVRPNPGRSAFNVLLSIGRSTNLALNIYDVGGRRVRRLTQGVVEEGAHSAQWDGRDENGRPVAAGIYLVRMQAAEKVLMQKIVLMR